MRFSMLFALTLVSTLSFVLDAQAGRGRRNRNRDCCPTQTATTSCCGTSGYGQAGYVGGSGGGYAVNSFGVAPTPQMMPMPGVVRADGTTVQPSTGIVQTSGTAAPIQTQQPMASQAVVGPLGVSSNDCCCQAQTSYVSETPRRRGLFRNRY